MLDSGHDHVETYPAIYAFYIAKMPTYTLGHSHSHRKRKIERDTEREKAHSHDQMDFVMRSHTLYLTILHKIQYNNIYGVD